MKPAKFHLLMWVGVASLLVGCSSPNNPSFAFSGDEAKEALREMREDPKPFERPVVALSGWLDPILMEWHWRKHLSLANGDDKQGYITLSFLGIGTFDGCRDAVIDTVQSRWPSDDPDWTVEVDVVGYSMGGLISRYAAAPPINPDTSQPRRLKIRNLYTIATPHRGAKLSALPSLDKRVRDMKAGSVFLAYLDEQLPKAGYQMFNYARLGDGVVGTENTAPLGESAWWVHNRFLQRSHVFARSDKRITADILRRLRGETPYTTQPPAPLP